MQYHEYEQQLIPTRNPLAALTVFSIIRRAGTAGRGTSVSIFGDALGFAKGVGEGAWDGVKDTVAGVGHNFAAMSSAIRASGE
jgi:hypothetical protein